MDLSLKRSGDRAVLTVHNTGEPIPPEALPHLFERFYRQDSARAGKPEGMAWDWPSPHQWWSATAERFL